MRSSVHVPLSSHPRRGPRRQALRSIANRPNDQRQALRELRRQRPRDATGEPRVQLEVFKQAHWGHAPCRYGRPFGDIRRLSLAGTVDRARRARSERSVRAVASAEVRRFRHASVENPTATVAGLVRLAPCWRSQRPMTRILKSSVQARVPGAPVSAIGTGMGATGTRAGPGGHAALRRCRRAEPCATRAARCRGRWHTAAPHRARSGVWRGSPCPATRSESIAIMPRDG